MKYLNALSRIFSNAQRSTDLLSRIYENLDNQSAAVNSRLDHLATAWNNQSTAVNSRLDRLIKCSELQLDAQKTLTQGHAMGQGANGPSSALPPPTFSGGRARPSSQTNDLEAFQPIIDSLKPWSGHVPKGYLVDFLGVLTDAVFREQFGVDPNSVGGTTVTAGIPPLAQSNAEWWFETINWFLAAQEARDRYVMVTLGACYGAQAVGAHRVLQLINPMPCKLVAVEGDPVNFEWLQRHFRDNGIDPNDHWLLPLAINSGNSPVFFPIGAPGSGANNCFATNDANERRIFAEQVIAQGKAETTLKSLMMHNSTGIIKDLIPGQDTSAEIKSVSAVTLRDVLGPFDLVDYVEADIQQSEILVFPPFMDLLRRKVRRIHIGTHGEENHNTLHDLFELDGWEIVFSYGPDATHESALGTLQMNDGVLTVRNPDL